MVRNQRNGFTLLELLVVITIIGLVSIFTIPAIVSSVGDQRILSSAQMLQGALVNARDLAAVTGRSCGVRLLPSDTIPGTFDRAMGLRSPENYVAGLVSVAPDKSYSAAITGGLPCLVLEQSPLAWQQTEAGWVAVPNEPTSWTGNIRLGDRVQIRGQGSYCVCGPWDGQNGDLFVGLTAAPITQTYTAPDGVTQVTTTAEYLLLVNGRDDNQDGFVDNGWDGIDNDQVNGIDDPGEWIETEAWTTPAGTNLSYQILRRPVALDPTAIVHFAVPVSLSASQLTVNAITGNVDVMIQTNGVVDMSGPYATPAAIQLGQNQSLFVFQDNDGHQHNVMIWTRTGRIEADVTAQGQYAVLP